MDSVYAAKTPGRSASCSAVTRPGILFLLVFLSCFGSSVFADGLDRKFHEVEERWRKRVEEMGRQWQKTINDAQVNWEKQKAAIEQKWNEFKNSSRTEWVSYFGDLSTRSVVDFEEGTVTVEAIVPTTEKDAASQLEKLLSRHSLKIMTEKNDMGKNVLRSQISVPGTEATMPPSISVRTLAADFGQHEAMPVSFKAHNGTTYLKKTVTFDLLPNHLERRVKRYLPYVKKYSNRYGVEPGLVLSVIEAESYFNPLARSNKNAYGLMQLVPSDGAKEAAQKVGHPTPVKSEDLYQADLNIKLGAAYLSILRDRYFPKFKNHKAKQDMLVIAAYNYGPTRIKRYLKKHRTGLMAMSDSKFLSELKRILPGETRRYLDKVTANRTRYRL